MHSLTLEYFTYLRVRLKTGGLGFFLSRILLAQSVNKQIRICPPVSLTFDEPLSQPLDHLSASATKLRPHVIRLLKRPLLVVTVRSKST